jgi:RNA polymerase sigma factor (sigma-70 family)
MEKVSLEDVKKLSRYIRCHLDLEEVTSIMTLVYLECKEVNNNVSRINKRDLINRTISEIRTKKYSNSFGGKFNHVSLDAAVYDTGYSDDYSELEFNSILSSLPAGDANIIYWRFACSMNHSEIANRLGVERSTVTSRLKRILKRLKSELRR